jgi:NAD(P)H-dependent FMN reductase
MSSTPLKIAVMIGSIRKTRRTDKPAFALIDLLKERNMDPILIDLQELDLPLFDDGIEHEGRTKLLSAYREMDALIILNPEYNNSISSAVKNAIDYSRDGELDEMPAAIVTTSAGRWGGARSVSQVRNAWFGVGAIAVPPVMQIPSLSEFDGKDEAWIENANKFLDRALRWFRIIQDGKAANK